MAKRSAWSGAEHRAVRLLQRWLELRWSGVELIGHKDELREHAGVGLRYRVVLDRVQYAAVRFSEALPGYHSAGGAVPAEGSGLLPTRWQYQGALLCATQLTRAVVEPGRSQHRLRVEVPQLRQAAGDSGYPLDVREPRATEPGRQRRPHLRDLAAIERIIHVE